MDPVTEHHDIPGVERVLSVRVADNVAVATVRRVALKRCDCVDLRGALLVLADQHAGRVVCSFRDVVGVVDQLIDDLLGVQARCGELGGSLTVCDLPKDLEQTMRLKGIFEEIGWASSCNEAVERVVSAYDRRVA